MKRTIVFIMLLVASLPNGVFALQKQLDTLKARLETSKSAAGKQQLTEAIREIEKKLAAQGGGERPPVVHPPVKKPVVREPVGGGDRTEQINALVADVEQLLTEVGQSVDAEIRDKFHAAIEAKAGYPF